MIRRVLLTTAFVVATLASASAIELECGPPHVTPADPADVNPVIRVIAKHEQDGWQVLHYLRDGTVVSRGEQYAIVDWSNTKQTQWQGMYRNRGNLIMIGEVKKLTATGQLIYVETMYDLRVDGVAPAMQATAACQRVSAPPPVARAPVPQTASTNPSGKDSVPIVVADSGKSVKVDVLIGGQQLRMLIDTGATHTSIPTSFAMTLIRIGQAVVVGTVPVRYADGRVANEIAIRISELRIGNHIVRNVMASISDGAPLLPFPILNDIAPFTIDTRAGELIWHTTRG